MINQFHLLDGGYCTHKENRVLKSGRCCESKFPAMFACIKHEKFGYILYDTGYSKRFFEETSSFPFSIYAKLTPVYLNDEDCALSKLEKLSISSEAIKYIIISHFHADHIAALKDFPNATFIYLQTAYDKLKNLGTFSSLKNGFLKGLLPPDFEQRTALVPFQKNNSEDDFISYDLFGDSSLTAVELPGHAQGQIGLKFTFNNKVIFLIADSCWMSESYEKNIEPSAITYLISDNKNEYKETLLKLQRFHQTNPDAIMIPSHCGRKFIEHIELSNISSDNLNGI